MNRYFVVVGNPNELATMDLPASGESFECPFGAEDSDCIAECYAEFAGHDLFDDPADDWGEDYAVNVFSEQGELLGSYEIFGEVTTSFCATKV